MYQRLCTCHYKNQTNKRAMMALGRSPEHHWDQIISKSVHWFSRRSRLKLFSIYSPWGPFCSAERNGLEFAQSSPRTLFNEYPAYI